MWSSISEAGQIINGSERRNTAYKEVNDKRQKEEFCAFYFGKLE
jgi:hypothetical protein